MRIGRPSSPPSSPPEQIRQRQRRLVIYVRGLCSIEAHNFMLVCARASNRLSQAPPPRNTKKIHTGECWPFFVRVCACVRKFCISHRPVHTRMHAGTHARTHTMIYGSSLCATDEKCIHKKRRAADCALLRCCCCCRVYANASLRHAGPGAGA